MAIEVTVLEFPEGSPLRESSMTFSEQGGTIGRTQNNTWVLDDPERFLSGNHCQISCINGEYFLTDTSTNGTFVNNSAEPLGKGNQVRLNSGDVFELSDYKFRVQVLDTPSSIPAPQTSNIFDSDDPFATPAPPPISTPAAPVSSTDPFASPMAGELPMANELPVSMAEEETDPLAALNKSQQSFEQQANPADPFGNSYSDNANSVNQAVDWPSANPQSGLIPEDWDDDDLMDAPAATSQVNAPKPAPAQFAEPVAPPEHIAQPEPVAQPKPAAKPEPVRQPPADFTVKPSIPPDADATAVSTEAPPARQPQTTDSDNIGISLSQSEARRRALEKENRKIRSELTSLKKKVLALKKRSTSDVDTTLIDAIGFDSQALSDDKINEINELSGEFIRQVVAGLMQTLASRNNVKNTFRMNMTTIQPVENNPLKFSANVDDALENMFLKDGNSYKKPVETIQESFESIADHQVAILAGIRSAFKSIVNRFEPATLETRFEKQNKRGLIPRNEKARNWEAYNDYYDELFRDIDSSFQYLFGDEFSQAYEEQLQLLSHARKDKNAKK